VVSHGKRSGYVAGCRCGDCTTAQRDYMREYMRAYRLGIRARDVILGELLARHPEGRP
jgi:hypothetical protein